MKYLLKSTDFNTDFNTFIYSKDPRGTVNEILWKVSKY